MGVTKNILITDAYGRPMATDVFLTSDGRQKPVVIYAHGFNGFKDWGNFDLIAARFAAADFVFIKFNFSFNGTTPEHPEDFVDLEGYAQNNYTKELSNLQTIIDWVGRPDNPFARDIDAARLGLLGHSLGGGMVLLKAGEEERVKAVATWASIAECQTPWASWPETRIREWRETGVQIIANGRTGQQMPLGYQLFEDYQQHRGHLSIEQAIKSLHISLLLCHGTQDSAVPVDKVHLLKSWHPAAKLVLVDSDHVFGRKHPWTNHNLPQAMETVLQETLDFFHNAL